jgi:large subunit ribosomal protein L14
MLQRGTNLIIADNSGAKVAKVIGIPGYSKKLTVGIGDIVNIAVQKATPHSGVKTHDVQTVVVIRTRKETRRKDGSYVRFDDNAGVIIDAKKKTPVGTRIFGPVAREVKERGFDKIASLASEVL